MVSWLRPLLMMFSAPARGMSEVRDRSPLAAAMLLALLAQIGYAFSAQWRFLMPQFARHGPSLLFSIGVTALLILLMIAVIFVPTMTLFANLFERRGSFRLVIQQEFAALASTTFYAWAAANLAAIPLVLLARVSGLEENFVGGIGNFLASLKASALQSGMSEGAVQGFTLPSVHQFYFAVILMLPLFIFWVTLAVREVFRLSGWRAIGVILLSGITVLVVSPVIMPLFGTVLFSPFLLIFFFILLRGYFSEVTRGQRARASFKQNLEAATLNPADASAHYNLGLVQQQRGELDEARRRFERAIEIDPDEVDAHYQLGRIAREQGRLPDAINHFTEVVTRDQMHAQHEIWRETGATYLAAGQFEDARAALERFLENRTSDPQGLYLMGRALAGLGRPREAADSMQACIEAVRTAPAYKYRTEKRWLNEAQQFLRSQA